MRAQILYDLREATQFCSGTDLHDFFRIQLGEPSPSGEREIDTPLAMQFVASCFEAMAANSPSLAAEIAADWRDWQPQIF